MKLLKSATVLGLLALSISSLTSCSEDAAPEAAPPAARGILTTTQQQALDSANSLEQSMQEAAAARERELQERLRQQ